MSTCKNPQADICDQYCPSCTERVDFLRGKLTEVAGLSEIFRILGDETRTKIIYLLSLQELCVCDLADLLELTMPAVSHHLRLLKSMRLVKHRRDGKQVYYSLDDEHIVDMIKQAQQHFAEGR